MGLRTALFSPATFFERERPTTLTDASLVMLGVGVSAAGSLVLSVLVVLGVHAPRAVAGSESAQLSNFGLPSVRYAVGTDGFASGGLPAGLVVFLLFLPFASWLLLSGVVHVLSWPLASEGTVRETVAAVAWGFLPVAAANALTFVGVLIAFLGGPPTFEFAFVGLLGRAFAQSTAVSPVLAATNLLGVGCLLWSGYLWTHALATVRGLDRRHAALVVAVPVGLALFANVSAVTYGLA
jgi:hypothetical protein